MEISSGTVEMNNTVFNINIFEYKIKHQGPNAFEQWILILD
jgi:hypothetical protein